MTTYELAELQMAKVATISIIARDLYTASKGALTYREAIARARAVVARQVREQAHAAVCVVRSIELALTAGTQADADRYTDAAVRFLAVAIHHKAA